MIDPNEINHALLSFALVTEICTIVLMAVDMWRLNKRMNKHREERALRLRVQACTTYHRAQTRAPQRR